MLRHAIFRNCILNIEQPSDEHKQVPRGLVVSEIQRMFGFHPKDRGFEPRRGSNLFGFSFLLTEKGESVAHWHAFYFAITF